MKFLLICALLACLLIAGDAQVFTTCARMNDGPLGAKAAEVACFLSCKARVCNNSKCVFRAGRPVCVCGRCTNG